MTGPGDMRFGNEERKEVLDVLESGHLSRYGALDDPGFKQKVLTLEKEFAAVCGVGHAVATNSGTSALLIALLAAGIKAGDEVLVPGFTYVASISAIIHARAIPVLVEIDESLCVDPEDARSKITSRTRAIMPVHMLGNPVNMKAIMTIAEGYGLTVIEDCCQAGGASFDGRRVGSFGEFGAFSFNRYKMMSTGDGGMLVTNDTPLYERAFAVHDQGHIPLRSGGKIAGHPRSLIGLNLKMNELTGAVALAQLRKVDGMLETLRRNKAMFKAELTSLVPDMKFRTINDPKGECATILTVLFPSRERAETVASRIGTQMVGKSGWHVYGLMDQIVEHKTPYPDWSEPARFAQPGDLPRTDDILGRAVNISIGVVDKGIGASFGVNITSNRPEILEAAATFAWACRE